MAGNQGCELFAQGADMFKVSISGISLQGRPEAEDLNGDYLLPLVARSERQCLWKLSFPEVCGFSSIYLTIARNRSGGWDLRVCLQGTARDRPTWVQRDVESPSGLYQPVLVESSVETGTWPKSVQAGAIESGISRGPFGIASQPGALSTMAAAGSGPGSVFPDPICDCHGCGFYKYKLTFVDIQNDECGECTEITTSTVSATRDEPSLCEWYGPLDPDESTPCGFFQAWLNIGLNEQCELEMGVRLDQLAVGPEWGGIIASCFSKNSLPLTLAPPPPDDQICDFSVSYVTVEPVNPDDLTALDLADCFAKSCTCKVECLPPPELNFQCGFNLVCCCHNCASVAMPRVPGVDCGTRPGCTCVESLNVTNGNLSVALEVPGSGDQAPRDTITYNSSPLFAGSSPTGNGTSSYFYRRVFEVSDTVADIHKCDGSVERYICKDEDGKYVPWINATGSLKQNYDSGGNPTGWTEQAADGNTYQYNAQGELLSVTNPCGETWTMNRGSPLSYVTDAYNRRTTYSYDAGGKLESIQDVHGRITTFVVDANGNLTKRITPELCTTEMLYDDANRLIGVIEPDGCRTSFAYDANDWCNEIQLPTGARYTYTYLDWGQTRITDPAGNVTTVLYDAARHVRGVIDPLGNRTTYTYWKDFVSSYQDGNGNLTTFTYTKLANGAPRLGVVQRPAGRTSYIYDSNSRLQVVVDPLDRVTTYVWNSDGRPEAVINALGEVTSYVYDANKRRVATIDPLGNRTSVSYDSVGQVEAQIDPLGHRTSYTYDWGQRTSVENPLGNRATTVYDLMNRVQAEVDGLGNRTSYTYDIGCRRWSTINPLGYRTTNVYDCDRLIATVDPLGNRTSFSYDSRGNRVTELLSQGPIECHWAYDMGRE